MSSKISEILTNTKTLNTNSVSVINTKHYSAKPQTKTVTQVRQIAQRICDKLNNQSRFEYYCKVAWQLPESYIFTSLEQALTGRDPVKYFSFLCRMEMR